MRLQPQHRFSRFEEPLQMVLQAKQIGGISGGGTLLSEEGEPESCDIEIDLADDSEAAREALRVMTNRLGTTAGSSLTFLTDDGEPEETIEFGKLAGLGVYLNGTMLPDEVYETNDVNDVADALLDALTKNGELIWSYWQGPTETALYFYGEGGFERMKKAAAPVLASQPLCEFCRAVDLLKEPAHEPLAGWHSAQQSY